MKKIARKGSLVCVCYYSPRIDGRVKFRLVFQSVYERFIVWREILNTNELLRLGIFKLSPFNSIPQYLSRKRGRKYYIFPRRNRIFMSYKKYLQFNYPIDILVPKINVERVNIIFNHLLEIMKFIPGKLWTHVNYSSDVNYRCLFKAMIKTDIFTVL